MNLYAQFYELLPLLSFILNIFLISLILRSDWGSFRNRIFALFLLTMGLWGFTIFGMRSSPHPDGLALAFAWEKAVIAIVPGVAVLFYHFTYLYTRARSPRLLLILFYTLWVAFAALAPTGQIVSHMDEVPLFGGYLGWSARFTNLGIVYLAVCSIPTLLGIYNLTRVYEATRSPEEKNRVLYIIIGASVSLLGAVSDFYFAKNIIFYPLGIVANLIFAGLTTIAMLRYRLLELRVVLRRGVPYTLLGIMIAGVYGAVFALFSYIFQSQSESAQLLAAIAAATVVAIALQPVLGRLQSWADQWFYRERYDHLQALQQFSIETKDITDLNSLARSLTSLVSRAMQADRSSLLLPASQAPEFFVASTSGATAVGPEDAEMVTLRSDSPVMGWLRNNDGLLTRHDLEIDSQFRALSNADWEALQGLEAELLIPIKVNSQLAGLLVVGPKLSEEDYSAADIDLLSTVVNQMATSIDNARLYAQESRRLAELEQLEKLKQTLLMTVSHELKTPLTAIKAGTEMLQLQEEVEPSSARGRLLGSINRGVERLERLIEESLDYARMRDANLELDLQPTDLRELVDDTVGMTIAAARAKRQTLEMNLPEHIPTVLVDRRRCERVLLNLISNANKYTDPGGKICVSVQVEPTYLVTTVVDNGHGIPENELDKIFNAYYRNSSADGKGAGASSGLGLAIAKYLVELHGGRIWVESKVGEGSAFHFSLPLGDEYESVSN